MDVYLAWLLVVEPRHMPLEWRSSCEGVKRAQVAEERFYVQWIALST
jgi:hypothetical protein